MFTLKNKRVIFFPHSLLKVLLKIKTSPPKNSIFFCSTPKEILNFYNLPLKNSIGPQQGECRYQNNAKVHCHFMSHLLLRDYIEIGLSLHLCYIGHTLYSMNGQLRFFFSTFFVKVKVFRYSFSEAILIFFNRLKNGFFLVRLL